ncbi:MAG TPA: hypothetical protein VN611_03295 [Patescibacteria group bacterium]|nr:hypothetical protein [Patescibacteria group bacterium]
MNLTKAFEELVRKTTSDADNALLHMKRSYESGGKPHSLCEVAVQEALANALECRDGVSRQHRVQLRFNKIG